MTKRNFRKTVHHAHLQNKLRKSPTISPHCTVSSTRKKEQIFRNFECHISISESLLQDDLTSIIVLVENTANVKKHVFLVLVRIHEKGKCMCGKANVPFD